MNTEAKRAGWRRLACGWLLAMMSLPATVVSAQTVNDGYDPNVTGRVRVIHGQGDGRLLIGGQITQVGGVTRNRIARIHPDGSLDADFAPVVTGGGAVGTVWAIHQQPSTVLGQGRILIGGLFDTVAGQPRSNLARINANGTLDASFNVAVDNQVRAFHSTMAPDGLSGIIYIGGLFDNVQGQARSRVAAIQANGTLMTHFVPPIIGGQVWALAPHLGGGLLAAGGFNSVGGQASAPIVRLLTASGAVDPGFNVSTSSANPFGNVINALAVLPDGRILIGGEFDTVNGQPRTMIARLLPDGTLDTSFVPPTLNGGVTGLDLQPDGRVVIVGEFTGLSARDRIARLNADGSLDGLFAALTAPNGLVHAVHVQQDGGVVLTGNFTHLTGTGLDRNRIARLDADGSADRTWQISGATNQSIYDLAPLSDGRMMVAGAFTQFNGAARAGLARLTTTGFVDSFAPDISGGSVIAMVVLPGNRVLIGGGFGTVNGTTRQRLALLNPDGSLDSSFNLDIDGAVWALAAQPDGKLLVGGTFTTVAGQQRQRLFRLNANGTLDTGFNPPMFDDAIWVISVQPDGRILVGGDFQMLGGWPTKRLARLQANGQIDPSFQAEANGTVAALAQLANGTVLVGGNFTTIGDSNRSRLAALNGTTGAVLPGFSGGANGLVRSILPRVDGKVYVAGSFTTIASGTRHRLALLTANGSLDAAFVNPSVNNSVIAMAPQRDGTLVIGGNFTQAGGSTRNGVARIRLREGVQQSLWWTSDGQLTWVRTGAGTTIAPEVLTPPRVWLSTECCDPADFIPAPGNNLMTRSSNTWALADFAGLYGIFYVKVQTPVGHRSTGLIETPIYQFDGGPAPGTDLAVVKTVTPTQASPGAQVTFTVQASNLGPNAATGVQVLDQLPSGYTYLSHNVTRGSYVPETGVWQIGELAATDAPSQAQMTVVATLNATGEYVNKAEIYGQQDDPIPGNNLDMAEVTVLPPADLRVAFVELTPAQASPGEIVEVQVRVHNLGPATPATGVQVASLLPAGLQFISSSAGAAYDPVTGIWHRGSLSTGTVSNLFINALVLPSGPYLHTATISGDQPDPQPGNNSASAELDVVLDEVIFANGFETPS